MKPAIVFYSITCCVTHLQVRNINELKAKRLKQLLFKHILLLAFCV